MRPGADSTPTRYRIGDLVLDASSRQVLRGDKPLRLGALTFDMLHALAKAAPAMVSYEELGQEVWQGRAVAPETIAQRAKMLRQALDDDAKSPRYAELVRGQGYRLIADVEPLPAADPSGRPQRRWPLLAAALALAVGLAFLLNGYQQPTSARSVAVLPFADLSPAADQQYLADGMAEQLISALADLDGLDVASRTESFYFRGPRKDIAEIGRELRVSAVLEGSVRKSGDQLRITVQLIEVDSGYHLWSEDFDGALDDIFFMQEQIAAAVAGALGVKLGVGGVNEFLGAGTTNFEAYEAFLREEFEKAIELDPNYAAAWGNRGVRIAGSMFRNPPEQAPSIIAEAYEHVAKALELDPSSALANTRFATVIYTTWDWERAEETFTEALELRRQENELGNYANMLMRTGRTRRSHQMHVERDSLLRSPAESGYMLRLYVDLALGIETAATRFEGQDGFFAGYAHVLIAQNEGTREDVLAAISNLRKDHIAYRQFFGPLQAVFDSPEAAIVLMQEVADDPNRAWPSRYSMIATMAA
ncbi:MAG: winged helix-turn-helix domain-containing protein, partial [Pseudomonadota bacterium]